MSYVESIHPPRRRRLRVVLSASVLIAAAVGAVALHSGPSDRSQVVLPLATTPVICGQTVTTSIVVGNDLNCTSGNGLNVGASGITINLNGHTLTGASSSSGVGVSATQSGVTIENGTVATWFHGVFTAGSLSKVINIRATGSTSGITVSGFGSTVSGNTAFANSQDGIQVFSDNIHVTSNTVRENTRFGINVQAAGIVVQTNRAENNGSDGVEDQGGGVSLIGNVSNANTGDGINSAGDQTAKVGSNTANYNGAYGIEANAGGNDAGGNVAKSNTQPTQCKDVVCS